MRALVLGLLVCAGCLQYEITIATKVNVDGSFERTVKIFEKTDKHHTWRRFQQPGAPYAATGSDAEGHTLTAGFKAGRRPGGLRFAVAEGSDKYDGANTTKGLRAVENSVHVRVDDLFIGKLYSYRETIDIGADPVYVRKELKRFLGVGLTLLMRTLAIRFPGADFQAVGKRAREVLVPRVEASLLTIHDAASALLLEQRRHPRPYDTDAWLDHPKAKIILAELKRYGVEPKKPVEGVNVLEEFVAVEKWWRGEAFVDEFLAPLADAKLRAAVRAAILDPATLEESLDRAGEDLYPDEQDKKKLQDDVVRFGVAAVGGYMLFGFLDDFKVSATVTLPGTLMRTNGDLGGAPRWRLHHDDLILVAPTMSAYSFAPAKGAPKDGYALKLLLNARHAVASLDAKQRGLLDEVVYGARRSGSWPEKIEDKNGIGDAYQQIRAAAHR